MGKAKFKSKTKVGGIYGKPWSKMSKIPVSPDILEKIGKILVQNIVREARIEIQRSRALSTMNLPDSPKFFESFKYKISGKSTIEIYSTYPWIQPIVDGTGGPFPMEWLTQKNGVRIVPLKGDDGTVIFRVAPLQVRDAWIHPGISKHNFLRRGLEKGRKEAAKVLGEFARDALAKGDPMK